MFYVVKSTSQRTGIAPRDKMHPVEAKKILAVTTTSSPSPIFRDLRAVSNATVPLATAREYFASPQVLNSFSNYLNSVTIQ